MDLSVPPYASVFILQMERLQLHSTEPLIIQGSAMCKTPTQTYHDELTMQTKEPKNYMTKSALPHLHNYEM